MYIVTISHGCHSEHIKLSDDEENIYKLSTLRSLRFDKIKNTLIIRNRIDGDSYRYGGIRHKVKKLFIDRKMSGREKASIPIFCDEEGIFWIPGFALRDGIETADGEDAVVIRVYKKIN
jgi:tRNA(Ile)-lysidine synthetase-like protein